MAQVERPLSFSDLIDQLLGQTKQADPVTERAVRESRTPVAGPTSASDAILDTLVGFGKGALIDAPMGVAQVAANVTQATVPFLDLKDIGERIFGKSDSAIGAFIDRIPRKPSSPGAGFDTLDVLMLGPTTQEMARQLREGGGSADLAIPAAIAELTGAKPILEGLTGRNVLTGEALDSETRGRLIGGAILPAEITGGLIAGAAKQVLGRKPKLSLVDAPVERLLTKADLGAQFSGARAVRDAATQAAVEAGALPAEARPDFVGPQRPNTPGEAAQVLANDPRMEIGPEQLQAGAAALRPETLEIMTPESLRESIFGTHEDILASLRDLPPGKRSMQISEQIADVMQTQLGVAEARISEFAERYGVPRQQVVDTVMLAQQQIAGEILKGKGAAGGFLKELSDVSKTIEALQETSPNAADRMAAANRRLAEKAGWMDVLNDIVIRPGLASAVSGFGNAMRDMATQLGVKTTMAFEHSVEGMTLMLANNIENFNRRHKGLAERQRPSDAADWADALHEMNAFLEYGKNVPDRLIKTLSEEGMEWTRAAGEADLKGLPRPPKPASLLNEHHSRWMSIIEAVPASTLRMISHQLADINSGPLRAEQMRLFVDKLREVKVPGREAKAIVEALRVGGDIWSNAVTMPRRAIDLEQRKLFFIQEMTAHAAHNGIDATTPEGLAQLDTLMNNVAEDRPAWLDKAYSDSFEGSLKATFSADPEASLFKQYLNLHQKFPIINWFGARFPRFITNKLAFIMDRNPLQVASIMKPEFIDSLRGKVDETVLLEDVIQATPKAKRKWQQSELETNAMRVEQLRNEARSIAQAREDFPQLRERALHKIQERNARAFARGMSGAAMLALALQIRNGGYGGARYNEIDLGPVNPALPEGERRNIDSRNWGYLADYLGLATVLNSVSNGRSPFEDIGADDLVEAVSGIRRINEDTILAVGDLLRAMGQGADNWDAASEIGQNIIGSNLAMFTAFFRNLKDVENLSDMVSPGTGEAAIEGSVMQDTNFANPWTGSTIANLPLAWQSKARELVTAGEFEGPLPPAINPFDNKPLYQSHPLPRLALGLNVRTDAGLKRLLNKTGLSQRALIGRSGDDEFDQIVGKRIGWLLGQQMDTEGRNLGDIITALTLTVAGERANQGFDYRLALKEELQGNFETIRETAKMAAYADYAQFNPDALTRMLATKGMRPSEKKFIEEALKRAKETNASSVGQ